MPINIVPKGGGKGYSPHRDVAYIYTDMCKKALVWLREANWEDWYGDYLRHTGTAEADIGEGAKVFAKAIGLFTGSSEIDTPEAALDQAGFMKLPYPVQISIYAMLGMILTGTFFMGIRDVTVDGAFAPNQNGVDELMAIAEGTAKRYTQAGKKPGDGQLNE